MKFGERGDIADLFMHIKLLVNHFRGYRTVTTQILSFSTDLLNHSYSSVSIIVLHTP